MTLAATCPECGAVFRVADEHAGRRFRCKNCSVICQVPERVVSKQTEAPVRKQRRPAPAPAQAKKRPKKAAPPVDEWEQDGYDEYNYDYDDYEQSEDYEDYEDYQPARRSRVKKRGRTRVAKSSSVNLSAFAPIFRILKGVGVGLLAFVGLGVVVGFSGALGKSAPAVAHPIGVGLLVIGYAMAFVGSIALLVQAFREDVVVGLLYLVGVSKVGRRREMRCRVVNGSSKLRRRFVVRVGKTRKTEFS